MTIKFLPQLSPEDAQQLFGWGHDIFDSAHLDLTYRTRDRRDRRFVLYDEQGAPVSHAAVLTHHAHANGNPARIGGIGGVVTVPAAQRRGYASLLVRRATDFLRDEWKTDFALLFCVDRMVRFYERLEWREVRCAVLIDQPSGRVPCPFHVMTMPFASEFATIESLDLGSATW